MRLTSKARYAIRLTLDLARNGKSTAREICGRQNISFNYTEQLLGKLTRGGILEVKRGPGGGFSLKHTNFTVREVLLNAGEIIRPSQEGYRQNERNTKEWKVCKKFFAGMDDVIVDYMNTTIEELLNKVQ
jgi:Rrf2 family protein